MEKYLNYPWNKNVYISGIKSKWIYLKKVWPHKNPHEKHFNVIEKEWLVIGVPTGKRVLFKESFKIV